MKTGIYKIENIVNGKIYIGLSKNVECRIATHKRKLSQNLHTNKHLQSSFSKNGIDSFIFEIIEECEEKFLCNREVYWISKLNSHDRKFGYNKTYGGEFGRLSDEIYARYSDRLRGCIISEEQKIKISKSLTGRKQSSDAIKNRAISIRKFSDIEECQMMDLFNYGFMEKEIALMFNAKLTTIHSIRRRFRNAEK